MNYRILILEDNPTKADEIERFLKSNHYSTYWAKSVEEMEQQLYVTQYDVVLVDMVVPYTLKKPEDKDVENGLQAIRFIRSTTEMIYRPKNIIIMSKYVEERDLYRDLQKRGYGYPIICYNESNRDWQKKLIEQIEISIVMAGRKADILISVAVDVELDSVLKAEKWSSFTLADDDIVYYSTIMNISSGAAVSVVLCKANNMGPIGCSTMVAKAISRFSPQYVFMIGIAAGNKKDVHSCDIVVANVAADYSYGKIIEKNGEISFEGRAGTIEIDRFMRRSLDLYKTEKKTVVLEYIKNETQKMALKILKPSEYEIINLLNNISLHLGKVVSGPCVVASDQFKERYIKPSHSDYIALDMETYSLYYAAKHSDSDTDIKFVSIKAISDMGDGDKKNTYQTLCVLESYNLVRYFIQNDIITI